MKRNFLVVAQNEAIREALAQELRSQDFTVAEASTGTEAKRMVSSVSFDAVLVESHLPDMLAEKLRSGLKKIRPESHVAVITSFDLVRNSPEQLRFGPGDYLLDAEQLTELIGSPFESKDRDADSPDSARRGNAALIQVIDVLVGLLELDDTFFGGSSHKAMDLAHELVEELSTDEATRQAVALATLLRDVGKVGIESDLFTHEGALNKKQKELMRGHVAASLRLFEHVDFPWLVLPIIRHHHERYNGQGYPDGLRGREIPIGARIVAVVDTYVALTSDRPHRAAIEPELALQKLVRQAGRQFDPEVVEAFQKVLDKRLEARRPQDKPTIMIVDEQKEFRRMMKMQLVNEGLKVRETARRDQALKLALKNTPDMMLVDLDTDDPEAFDFLEKVRTKATLRRVPFVLLSRVEDRVLKLRALREGVDDFLCKTEDVEELVARVQNVLTREVMRREGATRRARRGITGELENLSLPDIIQTLAMGMKSARVTISAGEQLGKIWFAHGTAVHAETGNHEGEDAFFEMVRWTSGEFVIEHGLQSDKSSLSKDTMFLLMEGLRLMDEQAQVVS